jgi:hydrogenase maturation protein HypF
MTSGNQSDEPIAHDDADASERLRGIADLFLTHNRPIHVRCDDSVTQVCGGHEAPIRRSRGYAPQPIALPIECPQAILAVGGQLKGTFALGRGRASQAILGHHLGDLDHMAAFRAFERDIELYERSFAIQPAVIAYDMHPDYASTRYALRRCAREGVRGFAVQHHHAHMAGCMAEHGLSERVIGVSFDGTGYGTDGAIWGGEFLIGDLHGFQRAAHFRYVPMPGGERAIKQPWRMAIAHLADAGVDCPAALERRLEPLALKTVRQALVRRFNAPRTSSVGRLFDAVASIVGLRDVVEFEGQAAMQAQWLAAGQARSGESYPYELASDRSAPLQVDVRPMIAAVASDVCAGVDAAVIAGRFHDTLARIVVDVCMRIREQNDGVNKIVLSGGVFLNRILAEATERALTAQQFCTFQHLRVPANDGGISLGQLAVAAACLNAGG